MNQNNSELKLSQVFWQQKGFIVTVVFLYTCILGMFIFNYKPTYTAILIIGPPLKIEQNTLSYFSNQSEQTVIDKAYSIMSENLNKMNLRSLFFTQVYFPALPEKIKNSSSKEMLFTNFLKLYYVSSDNSNKKRKNIIMVKAKTPEIAMRGLNDFLVFYHEKTKEQFLKGIIESNHKHSIDINQLQLFSIASPLSVSTTFIHSKLKCTIVLGIYGGLILGFIIAVLNLNQRSYFSKVL